MRFKGIQPWLRWLYLKAWKRLFRERCFILCSYIAEHGEGCSTARLLAPISALLTVIWKSEMNCSCLLQASSSLLCQMPVEHNPPTSDKFLLFISKQFLILFSHCTQSCAFSIICRSAAVNCFISWKYFFLLLVVISEEHLGIVPWSQTILILILYHFLLIASFAHVTWAQAMLQYWHAVMSDHPALEQSSEAPLGSVWCRERGEASGLSW